jgi:hypothetical protein
VQEVHVARLAVGGERLRDVLGAALVPGDQQQLPRRLLRSLTA